MKFKICICSGARALSPPLYVCRPPSGLPPVFFHFKELKSKFSSSSPYSPNTLANPIDMDTSHNWFAFSPSNHQPQPDLFEALFSAPSHGLRLSLSLFACIWLLSFRVYMMVLFLFLPDGTIAGGMEMMEEERRGTAEMAALAAVGPKLEDFLCGCGDTMGRFSGHEIYDSEPKNVAAGFLHGPPEAAEQKDTEVAAAESRKAIDTFGQRTSIYRGVTRLKR